VQEFILIKLHGETKVWTSRKCNITIDIQELTKYRRWLLTLVCLLLTYIKIININVMPNHYVLEDVYYILRLHIIKFY
jgi:hypothetical protein